jgi:hypothetical protein
LKIELRLLEAYQMQVLRKFKLINLKVTLGLFVLAGIFDVSVLGLATYQYKDEFCGKFKERQIACSCTILNDELEYCVSARRGEVQEQKPLQRIVINDRLRNVSKRAISASMSEGFEDRYLISVTDSAGNKLTTLDSLNENSIPDASPAVITSWPTSSIRNPKKRLLEIDGVLESEFILTNRYALSPSNNYTVTLSRRIDSFGLSATADLITVTLIIPGVLDLETLRDVAKDTVEKQRPEWELVSEREGEKESRYSWKSGREGISVLIFIGKSVREAKERMDFTSNRLSVGPGKPRNEIGDEAYFWNDEKTGMGGIRFRKGKVYIEINASSPAMAEDLAKRLAKEGSIE